MKKEDRVQRPRRFPTLLVVCATLFVVANLVSSFAPVAACPPCRGEGKSLGTGCWINEHWMAFAFRFCEGTGRQTPLYAARRHWGPVEWRVAKAGQP